MHYTAISSIDVCIRVVQYHSRSSLRAMNAPFDKDFRDIYECFSSTVLKLTGQPMQQTGKNAREQGSLNRRLHTVRKRTLSVFPPLSRCSMGLAKVFCHHIDDPLPRLRCFSVEMRNNVQRWLCISDVKRDLHRYQLEYMPGSCEWFLGAPQAQDCLSSKHSTTVRLQGRPGTGKHFCIFSGPAFLRQDWQKFAFLLL